MRQLGTLPTQREARTFEDWLLTQGIKVRADASDDEWVIWVYDEDQVERAREELAEFQRDPSADRYREAALRADALREDGRKKAIKAQKNAIDIRRRWERPSAAAVPVTFTFIAISLLVAASSSSLQGFGAVCDKYEPIVKALVIEPYEIQGGMIRWRGLAAIKSGQVWRLVTPIFIHWSVLHILFNMLWLYDLGKAVESRGGSLRFLLFALGVAVASNVGQYLMSGPSFGGMSGVVYALLGFVWMKSRYEPQWGLYLHPHIVFLMIAWFVLGFTPALGKIANTAHAVGLVIGVIVGYAPKLARDLRG